MANIGNFFVEFFIIWRGGWFDDWNDRLQTQAIKTKIQYYRTTWMHFIYSGHFLFYLDRKDYFGLNLFLFQELCQKRQKINKC